MNHSHLGINKTEEKKSFRSVFPIIGRTHTSVIYMTTIELRMYSPHTHLHTHVAADWSKKNVKLLLLENNNIFKSIYIIILSAFCLLCPLLLSF